MSDRSRDVESVMAARYWLTEKGWDATDPAYTLTDQGLAATEPPAAGGN